MRLIVTRPEPDASRTARALIRLGHTAILSPMLDVRLLPNAPIPDREYQAVLVTSRNAVRALEARNVWPVSVDVPLIAVGDETALEAKRAGFEAARSAGGSLNDLVALVSAEFSQSDGPLFYAAGEDRTGDLGGDLRELGFTVETAILYRAEARDRLAGVAEAALKDGSVDGILFYSQRSADAFATALSAAVLAPLAENVACFCLSSGIANVVRNITAGKIFVAERPEQIALFALIEEEARLRPA